MITKITYPITRTSLVCNQKWRHAKTEKHLISCSAKNS